MRIALVSAKGPLYRNRGGIWRKSLRYMPLTLPTLAALVPQELGARVTAFDEGIDDIDPETIEADLVGMTVITGSAPRSYELAERMRARGITVVLGGPHVTLAPDDAQPHADAIAVGYAEESWPELLRDFAAGRLRPRYEQRPDFRLAGSPFPERSILPRSRYLTDDVFETGRGCIHDCDFCVVPSAWGRRPFHRPVPEVIEEIRAKGSHKAIFVDLNLIADRERAEELFGALIPLRLQWYGLSTALLGDDPKLLALAARSGCRGLLIGLESISKTNLRSSKKSFNDPARYRELVTKLHRHRIALQGCFVFGLDDDTPEVFERTARFAVEARIDLPRFAVVTPFPGTPLHRRLEGEGRILTRNWELYDGQHVVFQPAHMTVQELQDGTERAWKIAYSLRASILRVAASPSPWSVKVGANIGYAFYARNLHRFYNCDWVTGWRRETRAA